MGVKCDDTVTGGSSLEGVSIGFDAGKQAHLDGFYVLDGDVFVSEQPGEKALESRVL